MKNIILLILISLSAAKAFPCEREDNERQVQTAQFLNAFEYRKEVPVGYCVKAISVTGEGWACGDHNELWSKFNKKVFEFRRKHLQKNRKMYLIEHNDYLVSYSGRTIEALIAVQRTSGFCAFY
ncbi:MAG: hypothetical protein ACXVCP_02665 [Bdellovibrio sp.]